MPKQKTHKGAAKRFKISGGGKLVRHQSMCSHIMTKKTRKRKRKLDTPTLIAEVDQKKVQQMLPYGSR